MPWDILVSSYAHCLPLLLLDMFEILINCWIVRKIHRLFSFRSFFCVYTTKESIELIWQRNGTTKPNWCVTCPNPLNKREIIRCERIRHVFLLNETDITSCACIFPNEGLVSTRMYYTCLTNADKCDEYWGCIQADRIKRASATNSTFLLQLEEFSSKMLRTTLQANSLLEKNNNANSQFFAPLSSIRIGFALHLQHLGAVPYLWQQKNQFAHSHRC